MRLMWNSNSPWSTSGYGVQTKILAPRIAALGHEIGIAVNHGLEGGSMMYGEIPIYSRGFEGHSLDILPDHMQRFGAEGLMVLYDAWLYNVSDSKVPVGFYFPVDMEPMSPQVKRAVTKGALRVAMSRHGQRMTENEDLSCEYAPHAYDPASFYPEKTGLLRTLTNSADKYVIGVVAANNFQPPRKCWPQLFEAFAEFNRRHPDSLLYVHALITTEMMGCDLQEMQRFYGIPDDAIAFCNQYQYRQGFPDSYMRQTYSDMDTLLLVSMGEGFGVPLVEAQACGTPVVTGEWTAMGELAFSGEVVPTSESYRVHVPGHSFQWYPQPGVIVEALERCMAQTWDPAVVSEKVSDYEVDRVVAEHWKPILEGFAETCAPKKPRILRVA